jgi:F-type H+-transporting ATPase subunit epsilon
MAGTFTLRIVSPEGNIFKEDVEFVVLPGEELGELGILPNHAPLIAALKPGVIRYTKDGAVKKIAISGGFVEVGDNLVTVLAETAELAEKIDLERAKAALDRAQKRLANRYPELDITRAELALEKAKARIAAKQKGDAN